MSRLTIKILALLLGFLLCTPALAAEEEEMEKLLEEESEEDLDELLEDNYKEDNFENEDELKKLNSSLKIADNQYGDSDEES